MTYLSLRIGLFAVLLVILMLIGADWLISAAIAAVLSLALSLLLFNKQRDQLSALIYERVQNRAQHGQADSDSDLENRLLDSAEVDGGEPPTK
jgi:uncharacterized protein YacL